MAGTISRKSKQRDGCGKFVEAPLLIAAEPAMNNLATQDDVARLLIQLGYAAMEAGKRLARSRRATAAAIAAQTKTAA